MTSENLAPSEISRRIAAGMGLVYDLFQEVNSLLRLLAQGLESCDADIQPLTLRGIVLPKGKKNPSAIDKFLKLDMGLLAVVGAADSDELADVEDDSTDSDGDAEQEEASDKKLIKINPETRFLGVRVILFDPFVKDRARFQPVLVAGLICSIHRPAKGSKQKSGKAPLETSLTLRRAAIKQLVKQLSADAQKGQSIKARAQGGAVHATIGNAQVVPLAELATEKEVDRLVDQLAKMAAE